MMQMLAIVGIGEDGVAVLRPEARHAIERAEVLVGGQRHHRLLPEHPAERIVFRRDIDQLAEQLDRLLGEGQRVVVLASGDPLFFGIGSFLAERFGRDRVRIYPDLGAVQLAFARLGIAWEDARVLSAHGRALGPVIEEALEHVKLAILTDGEHTPAVVARALLQAGMEPSAEAWCLERLGGPAERIQRGTLADCTSWSADPLNIVLIVREAACVRGQRLRIGLPEAEYQHQRGQITKAEVRALSVIRLAPRPGDVVWDVGAGSGSVSIEVARLCAPRGTVYAVERDRAQRACIQANILRHGVTNVHLVADEAPEGLSVLPAPDGVFVGGSGGRLEDILQASLARLRSGGRLVVNLATLEAVHVASTLLNRRGLAVDLVQVSIARGRAIGDGTRLEPLNPVFILSCVVPRT